MLPPLLKIWQYWKKNANEEILLIVLETRYSFELKPVLRNIAVVVTPWEPPPDPAPAGVFCLGGGVFKCHNFEEWWIAFHLWVCVFACLLDSISSHQILRLYFGKNKAICKKPFRCLSVFLLQLRTQTCHCVRTNG